MMEWCGSVAILPPLEIISGEGFYSEPLLSKTDTNLTARVANTSFADPELEF
jgi:hypothetical protein